MKNFTWFIGGMVIISLAFFIGLKVTGDYWFSSGVSCLSAIIYMPVYMVFNLGKTIPQNIRLISFLLILVLAVLGGLSFDQQRKMALYQRSTLLGARAIIGESMIAGTVKKLLIKTLYEYNKKPHGDLSFKHAYERAMADSGFLTDFENYNREGLKIYLTSMTDTEICIVSEDTIALGRKQSFVNYNGQHGKLQYRATLNQKGINYERQN